MAASMNWCQKLNQHKLFEHLRQDGQKIQKEESIRGSKNLLALKDTDLFVYNEVDRSILHTNLKNLASTRATATGPATSNDDDQINGDQCDRYQKLLPSSPPVFEVDSIQFNLSGTSVALIGKRGISVVILPERWGKFAQFEGGKEKIICRTILVGERLFISNIKVQVLQAQWYPKYPQSSHIAVLTSDNYFRIYDVLEPEEAVQSIFLGDKNSQEELGTFSHATLNTTAVLGETAIAFDFGSPLPLVRKVKERLDGGEEDTDQSEHTWPVFILRGSGDVCLLYTALHLPSPLQTSVRGPLSMYPPAEDNYGTDACAILCLPTTPPVLSVATCSGNLYHCAALHKEKNENEELSYSSTVSKQYEPLPDFSLFVYENVELDLSLMTNEEMADLDYSCPIRLHKDPMVPERYHCSHAAGVHTLMLPWLHKFKQFCEEDESDILLQGSSEQPAVVEHLVCTQPFSTSPPAPVLGMGLATDMLLGLTLLVLSADLECITLPLRYMYQPPPAPLLSASPSKRTVSPLRKLHKRAFDDHIKQILQRSTTNPILKGTGDVGQQECLQILGRVTQVFRQEYLQRFEKAHQETLQRVAILQQQKDQQCLDLEEMLSEKAILCSNAEALAEKYEESNEKQKEINQRLEKILIAIEHRVPVLSNAERGMQKELKDIKEQLQQFKVNLQQIKQKQQYQSGVIAQKQLKPGTSPGLSKAQSTTIKNMLKKEGDEIAEIVQKIKDVNISLET